MLRTATGSVKTVLGQTAKGSKFCHKCKKWFDGEKCPHCKSLDMKGLDSAKPVGSD